MPKRVIWDGNACFTTHVAYNHTPVFTNPPRTEIICNALNYVRENRGLKIFGYVIMPDHVHLLTNVPTAAELADILTSFRRYTATRLLNALQLDSVGWALQQLQLSTHNRDLWKSGFTPKDCTRGDIFDQKLAYIHDNPVRAGFVRRAADWRFSSAACYEENEDVTGPSPVRVDFPWDVAGA